MLFLGRDWATSNMQEQGEGLSFCCLQKACVGDGGELELALDDLFWIYVTVRSYCIFSIIHRPYSNNVLFRSKRSLHLFLNS